MLLGGFLGAFVFLLLYLCREFINPQPSGLGFTDIITNLIFGFVPGTVIGALACFFLKTRALRQFNDRRNQ